MSQKRAKQIRRGARKVFEKETPRLATHMLDEAARAPFRQRLRLACFVLFGPRVRRLLSKN